VIRRESTDTELDALEAVARRLQGFDDRLSLEWIDGALAAALAGPSVPDGPEVVLDRLFGDSWPRTFADPHDQAQALSALQARWRVLRSQLDPESLWDEPDALRLAPLLLGPVSPDEARAEDEAGGASAGSVSPAAEHAARPSDGGSEADAAAGAPRTGWGQAPADEGYEVSLAVLRALALDDVETCKARLPDLLVDPDLSAEGLVDQACWQAQDLRLWWIENAPRTAPRRVESQPGRNDPCPCGSGKKFKKCHGAG